MTDERFAIQVEHRLAGLLTPPETAALSSLLERSPEARGQYLRAVEVHLDLGTPLGTDFESVKGRDAMARMALNCSCGWNFFIPGTTSGLDVSCPSYGQTVRIPGRKPGRDVPMSPGEIAAEAQRRQAMKRSLAAAAAIVVTAGAIGVWISGRSEPPPAAEPEIVKQRPLPPVRTLPVTPLPSIPDDVPISPAPSAPDRGAEIHELKRAILSAVWQTNMAGLVSECLRYRNLMDEWSRLQAEMAGFGDKIRTRMAELAKLGEALPIDGFLAPGDQILGFSQRDFTTMTRAEAAALLHQWVSSWQASAASEQVVLVRNERDLTLYVVFPEATPELLSLVRHPALSLPGQPLSDPIIREVSLPEDVLRNLKAKLEALPAGTLGFLRPEERKRLEDLMNKKKGSSKDLEWIQTRLLQEVLPAFQRDADLIRAKLAELEPKLKENVASAVIIRRDGGRFEGKILEQNNDFVKIRLPRGAVTLPTKDILRVEEGKGAALEFPAKFAEAMKPATPAGKLEKLVPLLAWCIEKRLSVHEDYVACVILTLEASHAGARKALGIAPPLTTAGNLLPSTPK